MESTAKTAEVSGPITIDDVRLALGESDPSTTNANKIRQIIGRGGFTTIQKHLEALRAECAPAVLGAPPPAPPAPKEVLEALWTTAWSAAQVMTLGRLERLTAQRDAAQALAAAQGADIEALSQQIDAGEEALSVMTAQRYAAINALESEQAQHAQVLAQTAQQFADYKAQAQGDIAAAAAAAELAKRDAQIAMQTLQAELDKRYAEAGELRSLIAHLVPAAPPVSAQ